METPDDTAKAAIQKDLGEDHSTPSTAQHLVIKNCHCSAKETSQFNNCPVECVVLDSCGTPMEGNNPIYFPAWKVSQWMKKHAVARQRKKHVLSCIRKATTAMSQEMCDYA